VNKIKGAILHKYSIFWASTSGKLEVISPIYQDTVKTGYLNRIKLPCPWRKSAPFFRE